MDTSIWSRTLTNIAFLPLAFVQCLHLISHLDFTFPLIPTHLLFVYPVESTVFITYFEPYQKPFRPALPAGPHFHPYSPGLWCPWPLGATQLLLTTVAMQKLNAFAYESCVPGCRSAEICSHEAHHQLPSSCATVQKGQKNQP